MPEVGNRAGSFGGALRSLTVGPSGSGASPRPSGWPARLGSCQPSPAPPSCFPSTGCQWPPLSPTPPDSFIGIEVGAGAPGGACPRENGGSPVATPVRASSGTPAPRPHGAPGRCPRPRSMTQGASTSAALKRPPMSRRCCCPPAPSTQARRSPGIPQNSSWPSRHAVGWSSPPVPVLPHASALFTLALV